MKHFVLGVLTLVLVALLGGCGLSENTPADETTLPEEMCQQEYNSALELIDAKDYQSAEKKLIPLGGYQDSQQYIAYCNGMRITKERMPIKDAYDYFVAADGIRDSDEYVALFQPYVDHCEGIYRQINIKVPNNYILINKDLEIAWEFEPTELDSIHYSYDLCGKVNDHYKIFSELSIFIIEDPTRMVEFDEDYYTVTAYKPDESVSSGDVYTRIDEKDYNYDVYAKGVMDKSEELLNEADTYPIMDLDDVLDLLIGHSFTVDMGFRVDEYTFHEDNTYDVSNEDDGTRTYRWETENGQLFGYRNDKRTFVYEVRKYLDGQYLLCQNNLNIENPHVFIMAPSDSSNKAEGDELIKEEYFYECEDLITPDSVDSRFTYEKTQEKNGVILHTYKVHADTAEEASDVIQVYYDYLSLNTDLREKEYSFTKDEKAGAFMVKRYDHDAIIAVMQGGTDDKIGYFLLCGLGKTE